MLIFEKKLLRGLYKLLVISIEKVIYVRSREYKRGVLLICSLYIMVTAGRMI